MDRLSSPAWKRSVLKLQGTSVPKAVSSVKSVVLTEYHKSLKESVSLFAQAPPKVYGRSLAGLLSRDHCLSRERIEAAIQAIPAAFASSSINGLKGLWSPISSRGSDSAASLAALTIL